MLEQFYKDCRNELIGWCTTLTHDPMLAEDLVHEAFLRAMEQYLATLESLSHGQKKAWFYRVIKNMYIDRIRHQRFESVSEELPGQGSNLRSMTVSTGNSCLVLCPEKKVYSLPCVIWKAILPLKSVAFFTFLPELYGRSSHQRAST